MGLNALGIYAQSYSNLREKVVKNSDTLVLDTLSIIPNSLSVIDPTADTLIYSRFFDMDVANARLIWKQRPQLDSIKVIYRVYPILFTKPYFHKDTSLILDYPDLMTDPFVYVPEQQVDEVIDFGGLDYNGSFSRGISFGNTQDVVLNSSFNLQLAGTLGDDIEIKAAMTDNNIPIQPEGNTQQIQDFDQVYIELSKGANVLTVGDIELTRPNSYFMNFYKRLQGGKFATAGTVGNKIISGGGSVAVSKGEYARNAINGQEGNQGPYRLTGNNGETFIIVLAGTERVYIDGVLMIRGSENDYIIDYNAGEITFTPNRLITKDSRIVVEFEYSAENFFRSLVFANAGVEGKKYNLRFNVYSEQDSKNQPILDSLDNQRKQFLANIGDDINNAVYPGFDSVGFIQNFNQYKLIDTLLDTGIYFDSVFVFSKDPDSAIYRVNFSFVGAGEGNYRIAESNVNGRVYEWVAPLNGIPQGSYMPVILLVTPKKQQMATIAGDYKFSETNILTTEIGISNYDLNTFSDMGDGDDKGLSGLVGWTNNFYLNKSKENNSFINTKVNYEYAGKQFRALEVYRNIEFARDWSLPASVTPADEHLANADISFNSLKNGTAGYNFSTFNRNSQYNGIRHRIYSNFKYKGLTIITNSSYLAADSENYKTTFIRPKADISKSFAALKGWKLGVVGDMEKNEEMPVAADTLSTRSFFYHLYQVYIANPDTNINRYGFDFTSRKDYAPVGNDFYVATSASTFNIFGVIAKNPRSQLRWKGIYRILDIENSELTTQQPEESVLGRVEYNFVAFKGLIRSNTLFEVGSGQEQKREYVYLEVPAGQGVYVWNDDGDGIQELEEFEIASQNDLIFASFIKVATPTNEFIKTNFTQFNQVLNIEPKAKWQNKEGLTKVLARFSNIATAQINKKVIASDDLSSINPFDIGIAEDELISVNSIFRNTLYYNRSSAVFGADANWLDSRTKQFLTNGPESRRSSEIGGRVRWNIIKEILTELHIKKGMRSSISEAFITRNFKYDFEEIEPQVSYQHGTTFRVTIGYRYSNKENEPEFGTQAAIINQITADAKYNVLSKSTLAAKFSYAGIAFKNGDARSSLAYSMLEGLQPGSNYLWNLTYERRLANNIQIGISYDGRKSGTAEVNHVGRAQVRAVF